MPWEYESDEAYDGYGDADTGESEVDAMLGSMMEEAEMDVSERARGRGRGGRGRGDQQRGRNVPTARGGSAYRPPTSGGDGGPVTQQQFKEAMSRVGEE